jgi:NADPH:quinone reductase-like Zn-dependent oxidoreductase
VLLQTATGSSVGRLLTAVSLAHNISLVNVVRSERGAAELRDRFPDVPVVTTEHAGWADDVRGAADGRPVSVALDPIGGKLAESLVDLLAPGGTLICYGQTAAEPISLPASTLLHKSLTLRGVTVGHWMSDTSLLIVLFVGDSPAMARRRPRRLAGQDPPRRAALALKPKGRPRKDRVTALNCPPADPAPARSSKPGAEGPKPAWQPR